MLGGKEERRGGGGGGGGGCGGGVWGGGGGGGKVKASVKRGFLGKREKNREMGVRERPIYSTYMCTYGLILHL